MADLAEKNTEVAMLRTVDFSQINIGGKFTTDRWMWEKIDRDNAKALDELMGCSNDMLGAVLHFQPWSKVQLIGSSKFF